MSKKEVLLEYTLPEITDIILNYLTYVPWESIDQYTAKSFGVRSQGYVCTKCKKEFMNYDYWYRSKNKILDLDFCVNCWQNYMPKYTYSEAEKEKRKKIAINIKEERKIKNEGRKKREKEKGRKPKKERLMKKKKRKISKKKKHPDMWDRLEKRINNGEWGKEWKRKELKRKELAMLRAKELRKKYPEEKNLIECKSCDRIVYGCDKWWCSEENIDWYRICKKCFPKSKNEYYLYIPSYDQLYIEDGTDYDLSAQTNRNIPYQLEGEEQMKLWTKYINYNMYLDEKIGPIKQWVPFTELDEISFFDIHTCLLVDCSDNTNGRIALMSVEEYNEYANEYKKDEQIESIHVDIMFDNIHDYLTSYNKWKEEKILVDYRELYQLVNADINKYRQCFDAELALICNEFSSYMYIKNINYECCPCCPPSCVITHHKHDIIDKKNTNGERDCQYVHRYSPRV